MTLTAIENTRVTAIEELLNQVQVAVTNLVSKKQFAQLLLVKQAEVDALTTRIVALEAQVASLQGSLE